jgi:hypothetical protein
VLTSVHAFATDPTRGIFILAFLGTVIGSSLALFAWRAPKVGLGGRFVLLLARDGPLLEHQIDVRQHLATQQVAVRQAGDDAHHLSLGGGRDAQPAPAPQTPQHGGCSKR